MLFNSVTFLFFFLPVSLIAYYLLGLLPFRWRMSLQNLLLVGLSLVFFAWGGLDAVTFLVALIIVNYLVGLLSLKFRKILLAGVVCNVGALFCFKYLNTTLSWIGNLTSTPPLTVDLLVPLGISFIIFHNISYLLDIYNGKVKANKNLLEVALYILFFPKLIQGPIVKYYDMEKELKHRETRLSDCVSGPSALWWGWPRRCWWPTFRPRR